VAERATRVIDEGLVPFELQAVFESDTCSCGAVAEYIDRSRAYCRAHAPDAKGTFRVWPLSRKLIVYSKNADSARVTARMAGYITVSCKPIELVLEPVIADADVEGS
jgi:hypothetical protein